MHHLRKALRLFLALATLAAVFRWVPAPALAADTCGKITRWNVNLERDLRDIGDVFIWNTTDNKLHIRPVVLYDWHIRESWMEVKTYFGGLPRHEDGSFDYRAFTTHAKYKPYVTEDRWDMPFRSSWITGTEIHIAMRLDLVKLDSSGKVIDKAIAWGYQKAVGPALYFKHTLQTCMDLTQYDGCHNWWWDNAANFDHWVSHRPDDSFNETFERDAYDPDITLLEAFALSDNGLDRLARHAVAALLNAEHSEVNYPYSVEEVYEKFWESYDSQNYAAAANVFYEANGLGCPLPWD